jgi:hypothetical protein
VLSGLQGRETPDDLVEFLDLASVHTMRQTQLGEAAVPAGNLDFIEFQWLIVTRHIGILLTWQLSQLIITLRRRPAPRWRLENPFKYSFL